MQVLGGWGWVEMEGSMCVCVYCNTVMEPIHDTSGIVTMAIPFSTPHTMLICVCGLSFMSFSAALLHITLYQR